MSFRVASYFTLVLFCWAARADVYPLDRAHSSLRVTVGLAGMTEVTGTFRAYHGAISWNADDIAGSSVTVVIDLASIDTAIEERDEHLRGKDFFDVANHPRARFQSTSVEKTADGFLARGELLLHGVKRDITIPFHLKSAGVDPFQNDRVTFNGKVTIKRSDFGIDGTPFWGRAISDDVAIDFVASGRIYNYEKLGSSDPAHPSRRLGAAAAAGDPLPEDAGALTIRDAIYAAGRLTQAGKPAAALRILDFAETKIGKPEDAAALQTAFGRTYAAAGNRERAIAAFRAILAENPDDSYAVEMLRSLPE